MKIPQPRLQNGLIDLNCCFTGQAQENQLNIGDRCGKIEKIELRL